MTRTNIALVIIIAFLIGCVTANMTKELLVPKLHAGQTAQKWEYYCFTVLDGGKYEGKRYINTEINEHKDINELLSSLGKEGWELITSTAMQGMLSHCFKRPMN